MLWNLLIGFVIGLIARVLMPGKDPLGIILTTVLGICGAWFATFLGQQIGWYVPGEPAGFVGAVVGSVLILMVYRLLRREN